MTFHRAFAFGAAVAVALGLAVQADAAPGTAVHVSGTYTLDTKAKVKDACTSLSKDNPAVQRCTLSGVTLVYKGAMQGRGINTLKEVLNCATGKWYTDGTEVFTGSVEGVGSGTFTWAVTAKGTINCKKGAITGVSAVENLYSGTGALAGMYGSFRRGPATYVGMLSS